MGVMEIFLFSEELINSLNISRAMGKPAASPKATASELLSEPKNVVMARITVGREGG